MERGSHSTRSDRNAAETHGGKHQRGGPTLFWWIMVTVSGTTSLLATRMANPLTVDDVLTAALLFFVVPAVAVLVLSMFHRLLGIALAVLVPFGWLLIASDPADSILLWLVPVIGAALVVAVAAKQNRGRAGLGLAAASAFLVVTVFFTPLPSTAPVTPTTLLVGIDGASWNRIDPLFESGRLPNLKRLTEGGRRARLRSLPSLYSPQIWSTMATGCLPEIHGIWDFGNTQSDFKVGRLWDRMHLDGRSSGVCGWYFTWPPTKGLGVNDFVIPSTLAPDASTFPPEYAFYWQLWAREHPRRSETIPYAVAALRAFKHGVRLSTLRRAFTEVVTRRFEQREFLDQAWRDRSISADLQGDVFCELIRTRRPEFAAILMNQVDKVSHLYWKFIDPESFPEVTDEDRERFSDAIDHLYEAVDANLGKILELVPEEANIVIVSDHGFQAAPRTLAGQFCRIRTENLMAALGYAKTVFGTNVDRKVYLRPTTESFNEREATLERLSSALRGAHLSDETRPFFVLQREGDSIRLEIADRHAIPEHARLVLDDADYALEQLITIRAEARFSGVHHPDGVFLLAGPAAATAVRSDSLHVVDVAPTIAALMNLPFSTDWTGSPAVRGFSTGSVEYADYPAPSETAPVPEDMNEALKEQLRSMGYLE